MRDIFKASAIALGMKIIAAAAVFAMNVAVSRLLEPAEAGLFFLAYALILIISAMARLGLDTTTLRFVATAHASGAWPKIRGTIRIVSFWVFLCSGSALVVLYFLSTFLATQVFELDGFEHVLQTVSFAIPLIALSTIFAYTLQALRKSSWSIFILSASTPLVMAVLLVVVLPRSAEQSANMFVLASASTFAISLFVLSRCFRNSAEIEKPDTASLVRSAAPLFVVVTMNQIILWAPHIFLGAYTTPADVAVFNAAQRIAMLVSFILIAVNAVIAPKFASLHAQGNHTRLQDIAVRSASATTLFAAPVVAFMVLFPKPLLAFFGPEYDSGALSLQVLALGQLVNVATGSVGYLLSMTGNERWLRNSVLIAGLMTCTSALLLIPPLGLIGASIAATIGVVSQNVLCMFFVYKTLGINMLNVFRTVRGVH